MVKLMTIPELKHLAKQCSMSEIPKKEHAVEGRIRKLAALFFVDDGSNASLNMINAVKSSINSGFVYELSKHQYFEDLQEVRFWVGLKNEYNFDNRSIECDVLLMFNYFISKICLTSEFYFTRVSCSKDNIRVEIKMSSRDRYKPYIIQDIYSGTCEYDGREILNLSDVVVFGKVFGDMIKSIEGENE